MDAFDHKRHTNEHPLSSADDLSPASRLPDEPYYRRRNGALIVGLALLTLGIAWLLVRFADDLLSPGGQMPFDQTISGRRIEIDAGSADVTIIRWERPEFRIQAQRVGWSVSDVDVVVRTDGDVVRVLHGTSCRLFCGEVRYQINAPASADVQVTAVSGDVQISAIDGDVTVSTTSGDVRLEGVGGSLAVNTVSGEVTLRDGRVSSARVGTTSGDVSLSGVRGALVATTISGAIGVRDIGEGPARLHATSGKIDAGGAFSGNLEITSVSGDVEVELPERAGFLLFIKTVSGDIQAPGIREKGAPREWRAAIGDGARTLNIATTSGDIRIKK